MQPGRNFLTGLPFIELTALQSVPIFQVMSLPRSVIPSSILLMLSSFLLLSCQKAEMDAPVLTADPALVQTWRYPCGPACDASAWVLVTQNGIAYEAPDLPANFQKDDQSVSVQYRRTGKKSRFNPGTGLEIISIVAIRPR